MVGIVIVSHSRQLAEGVRELAEQMVQGKVSLAVAGGIDDPENPLGTDAIQVQQAIISVYSNEGVIVLMDLGSAILSAEMALEFLPEQREKIHLCEAPLVEGAIAAAVAAATSSDIEWIMSEARGALAAKAAQLGVVSSFSSVVGSNEQSTTNAEHKIKEICLTIYNRLGIHARPAAQFVSTVAQFHSQIRVRNLTRNTEFVRADSINQVATLGARQGDELAITAQGSDADAALAALQALIATQFGEEDTAVGQPIAVKEIKPNQGKLAGIAASPGIAIAPVILYSPSSFEVVEQYTDAPQTEWQRLQVAIQTARQEIQALQANQMSQAQAAIFNVHVLFLEDPVLNDAVHQRIFEQHLNAEAAWAKAMDELATTYSTLDDSYMQERTADVVDVKQRVLRQLTDTELTAWELPQLAILVAMDLTPSDTAQLDPNKVLGICTVLGSATSHSAILARTLGIPAVVGVGAEVLHLTNGTILALDGESGGVWKQPDADILATLQAKRDARIAAQQQARSTVNQPAITRDGRRVSVLANIGGVADAKLALNLGAEGVGLLRTEFLYFDRTTTPTEEEQLAVYEAIAQVMGTRPLIIRTLDIGGDKPLPYLGLPQEANPFLGWRGIRFCLDHPDILKTQLRAILRASLNHQIKVMFPMIATITEIQAAKAILAQAQAELRQASIAFDETIEVGIMVEVPSAVTMADRLATEVDFFSIGTNDLSQYVMACDRTNSRVASLADALHPAVLRMIQQTVQAGHRAGIWVGLCGELAADPLAVPVLLGLGLDEISLNPQAIPTLKQSITQLTVAKAEAVAQTALQLDSAAKVRAALT